MTMRSMPPASSHLADRPVPAPPPMIGRPAAILARKRSSSVARAMRGMAIPPGSGAPRARDRHGDLVPGGDEGGGEGVVIDVQRQTLQAMVGARPEALLDGREERPVGLGIVERLAGTVDRRDAALGD